MINTAKNRDEMMALGVRGESWEPPLLVRFALAPSCYMDPRQSSGIRAGSGESLRADGLRLQAFDAAVAELDPAQRRIFRLLLTGARVALIADATHERQRTISRWLGTEHVYLESLHALQRDLDSASRVRLHKLVTEELAKDNDERLEAEAWATLAVVRAVGRLDASERTLDHSLLRREVWSTEWP